MCQKSSARLLNEKRECIGVGYLLEGRDEHGVEMTVLGPCYPSALSLVLWASCIVGIFSLGATWTPPAQGISTVFPRKRSASPEGLNH